MYYKRPTAARNKRQHKHELFITFMAHLYNSSPIKAGPSKPRIMKTATQKAIGQG
jgi:hypothetical protein